ncbi:hypothetical protein COHA_003361 [Chlorella ohadii]|uniref:Ureidoglycolate hydrolase n=1 Tax=Chlorella ohadii TaxID=2649997 RepID=A0AAD5DYZ2_9CHLO|nr:hypothetical protein COHA_003361 [Chlorella ohadii]
MATPPAAATAAAAAAVEERPQQPPSGQQPAQQQERRVVQLQAVDITAENFAPFGQLVGANDDGKLFDEQDAQLDLSAGQPRFYIMRLPRRGRRFERITYHAQVTQCLGGLQPASPWFLVVARPTLSVEAYPRQADLAAFRIPHGVFVKMHKGTWHAGGWPVLGLGPLFDGDGPFDFYNLELSDTNVTDHNTHDYGEAEGLALEIVD